MFTKLDVDYASYIEIIIIAASNLISAKYSSVLRKGVITLSFIEKILGKVTYFALAYFLIRAFLISRNLHPLFGRHFLPLVRLPHVEAVAGLVGQP